MQMRRFSYRICFLLFMIAIGTLRFHRFAEGLQRRIHVSDDLNGEEGEELKQWGEKKTGNSDSESEPPANDVEKMSPSDIQSEMMKRVLGPLFGFVKLRLGTRRTPEMVTQIAKRWVNLARSGAIQTKFIGVDWTTVMFTMEKGQDTTELKKFLLEQEEAYEIKIGDQLFRRPGDPPFDEVFQIEEETHLTVIQQHLLRDRLDYIPRCHGLCLYCIHYASNGRRIVMNAHIRVLYDKNVSQALKPSINWWSNQLCRMGWGVLICQELACPEDESNENENVEIDVLARRRDRTINEAI